MTDDPVKQAIVELQDLVRCRCLPAYTVRKLRDPECDCDSAENVKVVVDRIEELEANLAKAVEAAYREGFLSGTEDGWVNNPRIDVGWKCSRARATLAELKGDKP